MEKSLSQYLDLYSNHKDLICRHAPEALNRLRGEACRNLEVTGLPRRGSENYELIDISAMLAPDYGLNINRLPIDVNVREGFRCGLPNLSSALFFVLNDQWAESRDARRALPEGVEIGPLSSFLDKDPSAGSLYGSIADLANPLVALNTMLVQEGVFIRVRKGVKVERPLQIVNLLENLMPLMAVRRLLIVLEEDSELRLLTCDHTSSSSIEMASSTVVEVVASRNARFDFYDMEESSELTRRLFSLYLRQDAGSDVLLENFNLHNGMTRNEFYTEFAGPGASLKLYGLGMAGKSRVIDNYSRICHNTGDCHTEELFKYIADNESKAAFTGRIYVAPGASKTEAYQSNRNIVGSDRAQVYSKPQLEIYNDDVKCSHGSATGRLDAMQLFYMEQRGLSPATASLLLKQAFMADVIDGIRLPILRDRVRNIVERRFSGENLSCGDCDACAAD